MPRQIELLSGFYRCQNCGRDVDHVRRVRRWFLCDECYQKIVEPTRPGYGGRLTEELYQARDAFWRWCGEMERKHPVRRSWRKQPISQLERSADAYYPFCECGLARRESQIGDPGIFGGPYLKYCPICEAKRAVESVFRMAGKIMPDRDDEDWLDLMFESHPEAFELGILPDYWYELKLKKMGE